MEDLAKQQKELSEQSKTQQAPINELKNKQEDLNKEFKSLQKELEKLDEKNQELEKPNAFENPEKETAERAAALPAGFLDIVSSLFVFVVLRFGSSICFFSCFLRSVFKRIFCLMHFFFSFIP